MLEFAAADQDHVGHAFLFAGRYSTAHQRVPRRCRRMPLPILLTTQDRENVPAILRLSRARQVNVPAPACRTIARAVDHFQVAAIPRRVPSWPLRIKQNLERTPEAGRVRRRLGLPIGELSHPRIEPFQRRRITDFYRLSKATARDHDQFRRTLAVSERYSRKNHKQSNQPASSHTSTPSHTK